MSESPARQISERHPSLTLACLLLAVAVIVAGLAAGWFAYARHGFEAFQAAVLADLVCWFSATAALLLAGSLRNSPQAVSGILGGMLVHFLPPLAAAGICSAAAPAISQAGLFGYMSLFFLLTLAVETLLLVWLLDFGRRSPDGRAASATGLRRVS